MVVNFIVYRILAKMKLAILSALVAGAAAFAPAQEAKQTTALAAFENEREFLTDVSRVVVEVPHRRKVAWRLATAGSRTCV